MDQVLPDNMLQDVFFSRHLSSSSTAFHSPRDTRIGDPSHQLMQSGLLKLQLAWVNPTARTTIDSALVKAIARAQRWQRLLESGECASITELAAAEKIDRSYLCRVLRLTLMAPEIVEAIMDRQQPEEVILPALMKGCPEDW